MSTPPPPAPKLTPRPSTSTLPRMKKKASALSILTTKLSHSSLKRASTLLLSHKKSSVSLNTNEEDFLSFIKAEMERAFSTESLEGGLKEVEELWEGVMKSNSLAPLSAGLEEKEEGPKSPLDVVAEFFNSFVSVKSPCGDTDDENKRDSLVGLPEPWSASAREDSGSSYTVLDKRFSYPSTPISPASRSGVMSPTITVASTPQQNTTTKSKSKKSKKSSFASFFTSIKKAFTPPRARSTTKPTSTTPLIPVTPPSRPSQEGYRTLHPKDQPQVRPHPPPSPRPSFPSIDRKTDIRTRQQTPPPSSFSKDVEEPIFPPRKSSIVLLQRSSQHQHIHAPIPTKRHPTTTFLPPLSPKSPSSTLSFERTSSACDSGYARSSIGSKSTPPSPLIRMQTSPISYRGSPLSSPRSPSPLGLDNGYAVSRSESLRTSPGRSPPSPLLYSNPTTNTSPRTPSSSSSSPPHLRTSSPSPLPTIAHLDPFGTRIFKHPTKTQTHPENSFSMDHHLLTPPTATTTTTTPVPHPARGSGISTKNPFRGPVVSTPSPLRTVITPPPPLASHTDTYGFLHPLAPGRKVWMRKQEEGERRAEGKWKCLGVETLVGVEVLRVLKGGGVPVVEEERGKAGGVRVWTFGSGFKLESRVLKGVPRVWRGEVWYYLITQQSGMFEGLTPTGRDEKEAWLMRFYNNAQKQPKPSIDLSILSAHLPTTTNPTPLLRLLTAFHTFHPTLPLSPHFIHLTTLLLTHMSEHRAFVSLLGLYTPARTHFQNPFYNLSSLQNPSSVSTRKQVKMVERLMEVYTPRVCQKLESLNVTVGEWAGAWISKVFLGGVSEVLARVSDDDNEETLIECLNIEAATTPTTSPSRTSFESIRKSLDWDRPEPKTTTSTWEALLPLPTLLKCLDIYLLYGTDVLPVLALALLKFHEPWLLNLHTRPQILAYLLPTHRNLSTQHSTEEKQKPRVERPVWTVESEIKFLEGFVEMWKPDNDVELFEGGAKEALESTTEGGGFGKREKRGWGWMRKGGDVGGEVKRKGARWYVERMKVEMGKEEFGVFYFLHGRGKEGEEGGKLVRRRGREEELVQRLSAVM
ncbi:hypothetical protein HDV05_004102 [Chytridiales sp. JEL 0842]|nr:hypothetical protein HDV05_004102 [Chytridiales sp. JEL 0842]